MPGTPGRPLGPAAAVLISKWAVALALLGVVCPAAGQETRTLSCGETVEQHLDRGDVHRYRFSLPEGAVAVVHRSDISGTIGLIRLRAFGPGGGGETCTDELVFTSLGGETTLEISDCIADPEEDDAGDYSVVLNVVSGDASNCAVALSCGSTPAGVELSTPGEVDGFSFAGVEGNRVDLDLTEIDPVGPLRLRVFGPSGDPVPGADDCDHPVRLDVPSNGRYTVLVSSCGRPRAGRYRLAFEEPRCPVGPNITYFGIASADGQALEPTGSDDSGRPIYERLRGSGLIVVIEGRPGMDGRELGTMTVEDPLPDMQMLAARTLGDGNPTVCDIMAPDNLGGVPGVSDLQFADRDDVRKAINDLGCRFDNGEGIPGGREFLDACTRSNDAPFGFGFVDPRSTLQFCAVVDRSWSFQSGDTVLAARLRDEAGALGTRREIVVRVAEDDSTPTPSPTRTPTRTRTPTPTLEPLDGCIGDCDESGVVQLDELIVAVDVALGQAPIDRCRMVDRNRDEHVDVVELLRAVGNSIDGCKDEESERD